MVVSKNLFYVAVFFLLSCSALLLAGITVFSPVYFTFLFAVTISFLGLAKFFCSSMATFEISLWINYFVILCYLFISYSLNSSDTALKEYILYSTTLFYLPLGLRLLSFITKANLRRIILLYFILTFLLLIIDFLYRIKNANSNMTGLLAFYNYKMNGLVSMDSNFSAFIAMTLFSFALYLKYRNYMQIKIRFLVFIFLLCFVNFSRAAILGCFISLCLYWYRKRSIQIKFLLVIFICMFSMFMIPIIINLFLTDYSFFTKTVIARRTIEYLSNATLCQLLFGNGMYTSDFYLKGIPAHNYISRTIIETGFIELLLEFFLFIQILLASRGMFTFILLPAMIAGLSLFPSIIPYFYAIAAIIIHIEQRRIYLWN